MILGSILLLLSILVIVYDKFSSKRWMEKYSDGVYSPHIKFNKKHLGIKKENV